MERQMRHRARSFPVVGTLALAFAATISLAGQTQAPAKPPTAKAAPASAVAGKAYKAPRTPDGQPDLQGFWTNSTYVPLERPNGVTKEVYTPDEAEAAIKAAAAREAEQTEPGTTADVHYDFSQFGLDRSQSTFAKNLRTSLIVDPPDGKMPPVNAAGQKRAQERAAARKQMGGQYDAVENMPIGSRCIIMGGAGPPMMNAGYNANYQIVQAPGYVMILTEMIHDVRIIPLDGRPQPPSGVRQWVGLSRGRWDGDTLVVETTNFNGKNAFRGASDNLKVTERFTRVADDSIQYRFTVEDPATWDRPWTADAPLAKTNGPIFEFACHESNYGIANILAGARADDKKAAEQKKGSN
jgi:cell division septation protein DedD